ncbi:MAG: hypothetical protein PW845_16770 [Pseudomonas sp.]|nr:hypothetical protein [Pseudomonas sp.]
MPRLLNFIAWLLLGLPLAQAAHAEDHFIVGVGTHLMDRDTDLPRAMRLLSDVGATSLRDDVYWSSVEGQPGQLGIYPRWRELLASASKRHLSKVMILSLGNQYYDNNAKPRNAGVKAGFARYVDFVSKAFVGQVDYYEIWNEWDLENDIDRALFKGRSLSDDYVQLVKDTAAQLHQNDPKARVLAGAITTQGIRQGFADRLVQAGALDKVDGLSLHPYVHCEKNGGGNTPESWIKWLGEVDQRLTALAGRAVPLYLTEMSWPSSDEPCGVDEKTQAMYLARAYFLAKTRPNIKGMWWYDLLNDGLDPKEREHNFGLLRNDLSEKPAYGVLKAIAPTLGEYRYDSSKSLQADNLYLLNFSRGDDQVLVAWTAGRPRVVKIQSNGLVQGPVQSIDTEHPGRGRTDSGQWQCTEERCSTVVTLGEFPRIISLGNASWLFTR